MGPTLRVESIGARVSPGLREARPIDAVGQRSRKAGLLTRAPSGSLQSRTMQVNYNG
jgi:hypothetical protein